MATSIEIKSKKVVGIGYITLSRREANEYEAELWEAFAYWVGKKVVEANSEKINSRECAISFFPKGENNMRNLIQKQNTSLFGEPLISPLFHIEYDKNLQIKDCLKNESNIPTKMGYMIVC